jgi:hypothetical protein
MIGEYNRKSLALGLPGLFFQIAAGLARMYFIHKHGGELPPALNWVPLIVQIMATIVLIIGLAYYAKAKGYHGALGLLGVLSCIGLIILAVLPDRTKQV